jgi:hypothetical protein
MLTRLLRTNAPALYIAIVLAVAAVAVVYSIRFDGAFACQASGYDQDRYLAYCNVDGYGEYDHGALPNAHAAARKAHVLFLGNSRLQFAFSTKATADWFAGQSGSYYLLGFSENERYRFEEQLVNRIGGRPSVFVINVDRFFEESVGPSARVVMGDSSAASRIARKQVWQRLHEPACAAVPGLCGREYAIFRSRDTGTWTRSGRMGNSRKPTSDDPMVDRERVDMESTIAKALIDRLAVPQECVLLTIVPTVEARRAAAEAVAASLGHELVSPSVEGLRTFDGSHLDSDSAERWSAAFFEAAGPRIGRCLAARNAL